MDCRIFHPKTGYYLVATGLEHRDGKQLNEGVLYTYTIMNKEMCGNKKPGKFLNTGIIPAFAKMDWETIKNVSQSG